MFTTKKEELPKEFWHRGGQLFKIENLALQFSISYLILFVCQRFKGLQKRTQCERLFRRIPPKKPFRIDFCRNRQHTTVLGH